MKNSEIKKILIIRLSALGDTIHTLPLANALRKKYPDAQIDWIVEDKAEKFVLNNPLLNTVYVLKRKNISKPDFFKLFLETINKIRKEKYDVVIDTQQLFKSGIISGLSGGKRRITLDGGREFSFLFSNEIIKTARKAFDIHYHVVKRNLEIAKYLECDDEEIKFVIPDFSSEYSPEIKNIIDNLDKSRKTIVFAPATTWDNKHWTVEGWRTLVNEFKNDYNLILTASSKETRLISEILQNIEGGNITDLSGKTTLSDLVYVYKNADLVVSPDSGSAHSAWAVEKPKIVTLFFATSAERTAPFGDKYFSLCATSPCVPCMKKKCRLKNDKNKCINDINVTEVVNILKKVL